MTNPFLNPSDQYQRDFDFKKHDEIQKTQFLKKLANKRESLFSEFFSTRYPQQLSDPRIRTFFRPSLEDRNAYDQTVSSFFETIVNNRLIVAPTMTVYLPPDRKKSYLAEFIEENIARRKKSKKEMFAAKTEEIRSIKNNEQQSFKIFNNSLSGAQGSTSTCLYNKTGHSSMTTLCRIATSYANANNEKFLGGNRHYWEPELIISNISTILNKVDYALFEKTIKRYGIVYPSVDQTMAVIERGSTAYWKNDDIMGKIRRFVEQLSDIERAAFVYEGDMYHLALYNDAVIRTFLDQLSSKATQIYEHSNQVLETIDDDLKMFVCLLCADELKGETLATVKKQRPYDYAIIEATVEHILKTLSDYRLLIETFWRVQSVASSVADIPNSVRKTVVASDTDSTIFTTQYWVQWFCGTTDFTPKANAISYAITYMVTQSIAHILALVSAEIGVEQKHIHRLMMKNEFSFPVFVKTTMGKNYYAYVSAQEGTVYDQYKMEVKGKNLIDSNAPREVMDMFTQTMRDVMDSTISGQMIDIRRIIKEVSDVEMDVVNSINTGGYQYLSRAQVRTQGSYKKEDGSPFLHFLMWRDVFEPKYGHYPQLPYDAFKLSLDLDKRSKIEHWLKTMEDQELAARMQYWLHTHGKPTFSNALVPRNAITEGGVPKEFLPVLNYRKIMYQTTKPFYFMLETLGIHLYNKNLTRLISDITKY